MDVQTVVEIIREGIYTLIIIAAPAMLVSLIIGLIISLFQALTQIQEMTLTFVPKIIAIMLTLMIALPFMMNTLIEFTLRLSERIVHIEE